MRIKEHGFDQHQQYRDRIEFFDEENNITDIVTLIDKKWWIQVTVTSTSARPSPNHCQIMRRAVKDAMDRAIVPWKPQFNKFKVIKVFPCVCPRIRHADHYCTLNGDKSRYICSIERSFTGFPTDDMLCWSGS